MAGGRIQYNIEFNVDSQNNLKKLEQALINIQTKAASSGGKMKQEYQEAAKIAKQLSVAIDQSFNKDLGTVNINRFNAALQKANLNIHQINSGLGGVPEGATAYNLLASKILNTNIQLKQSNKLLDEMATTMANTVRWGVTSSIFKAVTDSISKAYSFSKQLNSSLTDIRIVTSKTADEMERFAESANKAAKNLATSTTNYTNASLIYYQQGLSDEEVAARTETTIKAANVTGQSADAVSEQLTAVWNGYKVNAEEAELYVDKLAAVAATTAADLEELSTGMSKVASAANIMGVDMDQLNAQLATIVSVTRQAPESVGTALKTIYARMGDIEAGLDTETTLGNYTQQMADMGFNVLDANGALRDMGDVIEEIGGKWSTLSREQQVALSQTMAGTRQYNNLLSLFDNWDMYTSALETSTNAAGTLQEQQEIYFESTEAHLDTLKATWEDLYMSLIDDDEINTGIDLITQLAQTVNNFFNSFGGGIKSISAFGAIIANIFNKQISSAIIKATKNKDIFTQNIAALKAKESYITKGGAAPGSDAKTEDQAVYAGLQKELQYAERIKAVRAGLTTEEYNRLTALQAQSGKLEYEASLIEVEAKKKAESAGLDFQKLQKEEGYISALEKESQLYQAAANATNSSVQAQIKKTKSANKLEGILEKISNISEKDKNDLIKIAQSNDDIEKKKQKILEIMQRINEQEQKAADKLDRQVEEGTEILDDLSEAEDIRTKQGINDAEADEALDNANKAGKITAQVTALTTALSSMTMAWSSVNMLWQTWTDDSASFGDKMLQTFMTVGMVIPSVISSYNALSQVLGKTVSLSELLNVKKEKQIALENIGILTKNKEHQSLILGTMIQNNVVALQEKENLSDEQQILLEKLKMASYKKRISILGAMSTQQLMSIGYTEAEAIALQKAKLKQDALNASMLASPWTWAALAIAAVVAGIAIYTNAVHKANKAQIEEHKTAIEELKTKRKEIEQNKDLVKSYQDLKNTFDQGKLSKQEMYDKTLELCGAYADEINMLDLLEGRYNNVEEAIKKARLAELEELEQNSKDAMQHYKEMLIPHQTEHARMKIRGADNGEELIDTFWDNFTTGGAVGAAIGEMANVVRILTNGGKRENFTEIKEGQTTITLDAGYIGQDEEEVLTWLEASPVFQGLDHRLTLGGSAYELGLSMDTSTPEGYAASYRAMEEVYQGMLEYFDEPTQRQAEVLGSFFQLLQDNKEYVEGVEAELSLQAEIYAEQALYNLGLDEEGMSYSEYKEKRPDLYDEVLYSKEVSKEEAEETGDYKEKNGKYYVVNDGVTGEEINQIVDTFLKEKTSHGKEWLQKDQIYDDLMERYGSNYSDQISSFLNASSLDFLQAIFSLSGVEKASPEQLLDPNGPYFKQAQAILNQNKLQVGLELAESSLDTLLEGKDLEPDKLLELEKQFPELAEIWDKDSRAYIEALQQRKELQEEALTETYEKQQAFNWQKAKDALEDYKSSFEDLENNEFQSSLGKNINSATDYQQYTQQYAKEKAEYEELDKIEDLRQLEEELENLFKTEYELQLSITDEILTDIDDIVTKAEAAQKAVSMIGDGFKLSAEDSKELFEIFPELAQDAEVLADGTLQLNEQVVTGVLGGYGLEIDASKEKTAQEIQNRITELEMHRAEIQRKLDYIKGTAATEIDFNEIVGENQEEWAEYESKLGKETSENQVTNSAASAKVMIEHWAEVEKAAIQYAETAAAAARGEVLERDTIATMISAGNYQLNTEIETTTDVTGAEEAAQDFNAEAEAMRQKLIDFLQNLIDSDTEQIADLTTGWGSLFSEISEIGTSGEKETNAEIDRYQRVNTELADIANNLEKIQTAQEHLVGQNLISNLEQQLRLLEQQEAVQKRKLEIAKQEAIEIGSQLQAQFGIQFDENNLISNYLDVAKNLSGDKLDELNELVQKYDGVINDTIPSLIAEIQQAAYEKIGLQIEAFDVTINAKLDTAEAERNWAEMRNKLFSDWNLGEDAAAKEIWDSINTYEDHLLTYIDFSDLANSEAEVRIEKLNRLMAERNKIEKDSFEYNKAKENGTLSTFATSSMYTTIDDRGNFFFDEAAYQENLKGAIDDVYAVVEDIRELGENLNKAWIDTFSNAANAFDNQLSLYENIEDLFQRSIRLAELTQKNGDFSNIVEAYGGRVENYKEQLAAVGEYVNYFAIAYRSAMDKRNEEAAKEAYQQYMTYLENYEDLAEETITAIAEKAKAEFNKAFGQKFNLEFDPSSIAEWGGSLTAGSEVFFDPVESSYEIDKLGRKIKKTIDNSMNLTAQKKLNEFREKEMKMLREKDKLSEDDVKRSELKFELLQKQIALEESRNNKNTMMLRKDAKGNYSYEFVADAEAEEEAQQALSDARYNLWEHNMEGIQDSTQEYYSQLGEFREKINSILMDANITDKDVAIDAATAEFAPQLEQTLNEGYAAIRSQIEDVLGSEGGLDAIAESFGLDGQEFLNRFFGGLNEEDLAAGEYTDEQLQNFMTQLLDIPTEAQKYFTYVADGNADINMMMQEMANEAKRLAEEAQNETNSQMDNVNTILNTTAEKVTGLSTTFEGASGTLGGIATTLEEMITPTSELTTRYGELLSEVEKAALTYDSIYGDFLKKNDYFFKETMPKTETIYSTFGDFAEKVKELTNSNIVTGIENLAFEIKNLAATISEVAKVNLEQTSFSEGIKTYDNVIIPTPKKEGEGDGKFRAYWKPGIQQDIEKQQGILKDANEITVEDIETYWLKGSYDNGDPYDTLKKYIGKTYSGQVVVFSGPQAEILDRHNGGRSKYLGALDIEKESALQFDTGGYTGEWGSEGRIAILHEKELVLNATDTSNILNAVSVARDLTTSLANWINGLLGNINSNNTIAPDISSTNNNVDQNVHIAAEFPNVTNSHEVEDALKNLVNVASQYAFETRR